MLRSAPTLLQASGLLAAAVLCAAMANAVAGPERELRWSQAAPAPAQPPAPAPVPVPAPAPAAATRPALVPEAARPDKGARFPPDPAAVIRDISSRDARDAFALKVPFLDARRTAEFAEGHIPGAWSAPVWEAAPETRITEFEARANPGMKDPIVLYCGGGDCQDSRLLADKLVALGYRNLLIYRDGFPDWAAQGRPVARGAGR